MDGSSGFNGGLCLTCAKELGIKPVNNLMESMGISEEDLEEMNNQLVEYSQMNENGENPEGEESLFSFLQNQNNANSSQSESGATRVKEKKEQKPKRKFLTGFCEDLTAKARGRASGYHHWQRQGN